MFIGIRDGGLCGGNVTEKEADVAGDSGVGIGVGGGAEGDDGEVAVVTALAAEGEMDVNGGWRRRRR